MSLLPLDKPVDDLIPVALTNRPELAAQQALVQATLQLLRQEKMRPLIPSVLLRGFSTPVTGTLGGGYFGGGLNGSLDNFGVRQDCDVQVLWKLQNLGLGNRARSSSGRRRTRLAVIELFRVQDRVAAEVVQAYAQAADGRGPHRRGGGGTEGGAGTGAARPGGPGADQRRGGATRSSLLVAAAGGGGGRPGAAAGLRRLLRGRRRLQPGAVPTLPRPGPAGPVRGLADGRPNRRDASPPMPAKRSLAPDSAVAGWYAIPQSLSSSLPLLMRWYRRSSSSG